MLAVMNSNSLEGHYINDWGNHVPDACRIRVEANDTVTCQCRCGNCCERLIIEVDVEDAEREPRIASACQPLHDGSPEIIAYRLNDARNEWACHFFDRETRRCTIYDTRPLLCRVVNCDEARAGDEQREILGG